MGGYPGGESLETPRDLLDPDPELGQLDTRELLAMAARPGESVRRRGRP